MKIPPEILSKMLEAQDKASYIVQVSLGLQNITVAAMNTNETFKPDDLLCLLDVMQRLEQSIGTFNTLLDEVAQRQKAA